MLRKFLYGISFMGTWLATAGIAHAQSSCSVNGQPVECPQWLGSALIVFGIAWTAFILLLIISLWKIFTKAGKPGWASIVPVYNFIVQLEIINRPLWWILLMFIPFVNFIIVIILINDLAKVFGKGPGFTVGLLFLPFIFYPILAFGSATYQGNRAYSFTPPQPPMQPPAQSA